MHYKKFVTGLAFSLICSSLSALELSDPLHKNQEMVVKTLQNPITLLIDSSSTSSFLKVFVMKEDAVLFSSEKPVSSPSDIEEVLTLCEQTISENSIEPTSISIMGSGRLSSESLEEISEKVFTSVIFEERKPAEKATSLHLIGREDNISIHFLCKPESTSLETNADAKAFWIAKCIEAVFEVRLQSLSEKCSIASSLSQKRLQYSSSIIASCPEQYALEVVEEIAKQWEEMKKGPISEEEMAASKNKILSDLQAIKTDSKNHQYSTVLTLRNDLLEIGNPTVSLKEFMTNSAQLIEALSLDEINAALSSLQADSSVSIKVIAPIHTFLTEDSIASALENSKDPALTKDKSASTIVKPSAPQPIETSRSDPFLRLQFNDNDMKTIRDILNTVANTYFATLGTKQGELNKKGDKIGHVHPLRFLAYVINTPEVKHNLRKIKEDKSSVLGFSRWNGFAYGKGSGRAGGFIDRFEEKGIAENIMAYIPGFCKFLNLNSEQESRVKDLAESKSWEDLVKYLLYL